MKDNFTERARKLVWDYVMLVVSDKPDTSEDFVNVIAALTEAKNEAVREAAKIILTDTETILDMLMRHANNHHEVRTENEIKQYLSRTKIKLAELQERGKQS